jgi:hypothetical protein
MKTDKVQVPDVSGIFEAFLLLRISSIMYRRCKFHESNNMARWFAPLLSQLAYIDHHGQTICLLMQYVCGATDNTVDDRIYAEVCMLLSEIVCAHDSGGISAVEEVTNCIKTRLEVCHTRLTVVS